MLQLLRNLHTTKTSEKVRALQQFFLSATDSDKLWVIALFTGRRPKRVIKVSLLRQWACEFTQTPDWLFEESYAIVGDLAETIALLIPNQSDNPHDFDLSFWMQELKTIRSSDESNQKQWVFNAWNALNAEQRFVFNKLLTGGFRIGVSSALIVQALEKATQIPKDDIHYALSGKWDPYETTFHELLNPQTLQFNPSKPYPFCLAYPLEDIHDLGNLNEWQVEYKWDGIRGQLIKRGTVVTLWSRGEEIITESFPEIIESLAQTNFNGVLDGEILSWDFQNNHPKPFAELQKRLGRKSPGKKTIASNPTTFICYDLLEYNNQDLRSLPLKNRRSLLEQAFQNLHKPREHSEQTICEQREQIPSEQQKSEQGERSEQHFSEQSEQITSEQSEQITSEQSEQITSEQSEQQKSKQSEQQANEQPLREANPLAQRAPSPNEPLPINILISPQLPHHHLHQLRQNAKLNHTEGLMIKRLDSNYGTGRKRGDWWKWKLEPETADAVLIYAQKGHGKRASRYTDFTFALKKGDELVPFAKAYSGLSNKEIEELNTWIKDNTRERFGPVCSVNAELVFEIAFEGVNKSSRHKSGIAVRFPRIVRWRRDKKVSDINSVDDLLKA